MVWYRRRYRKRYFPKKKRSYRRTGRRMMKRRRPLPLVVPNRYTCKLRYADEISFDVPNLGVATYYDFRANDLFDPNASGVGHQPMGFDQLALMFNHFTVIGSKIKVRVSPSTGGYTTANPSYWGVALVDAQGRYNGKSIDYIAEQEGHGRIKQFGINNLFDPQFRPTTKGFSLKKFFNAGRSPMEDQFQCSNSASPTDQAFFEIWGCGVGGDDPMSIKMLVEIEYIVVCHEPTPMVQS